MIIPAVSLGDVEGDWPALADDCQQMLVSWTDGSHDAAGNLNWFSGRNPNDGAWGTRDWKYQRTNASQNFPEFNLVPGGNTYCAMWSGEKMSNWPLAIKVRYDLKEGQGNNGLVENYEAVVDLK